MNSALKTILWILVALVVIGAAYYWYESRHSGETPTPVAETTTTNTNAPTGPSLPSGSDTSDAGLAQDLSGVDAQMSTMNADTAAIDQGLNDTPIPQ